MMFSRRAMFARWLPGLAGGAAAAAVLPASASACVVDAGVQRVVYHLSEPTRVAFALGNIKNHIDGKGGPENVRIVLVVHGPALQAFVASKANPDIRNQVLGRAGDGVTFVACGNTMTAQKLAPADMLGGFEVAEEGGVVRIADLQQAGYVYIRP
jgi:intracellular sulfur oxidation DsrE/DsrF family protein